MSTDRDPSSATNEETRIAEQFVRARLEGRVLTDYPGTAPTDFPGAYRIQDAAIALWPEPVAGWKSTMFLGAKTVEQFGEPRLVGPVFGSKILDAIPGQVVDIPVIGGGCSGIEPEIVIRVGRDAPKDKLDWSVDEAAEMVGTLYVGAEIVSSPLAAVVKHGLPGLISDFGLNFGIVTGIPVPQWRGLKEIAAEVFIDDKFDSRGVIPLRESNGPLAALAFVLGKCARRGYPLRAGNTITTGTLTGLHYLQPGQTSRFVYEGLGELSCRAVQVAPRSES